MFKLLKRKLRGFEPGVTLVMVLGWMLTAPSAAQIPPDATYTLEQLTALISRQRPVEYEDMRKLQALQPSCQTQRNRYGRVVALVEPTGNVHYFNRAYQIGRLLDNIRIYEDLLVKPGTPESARIKSLNQNENLAAAMTYRKAPTAEVIPKEPNRLPDLGQDYGRKLRGLYLAACQGQADAVRAMEALLLLVDQSHGALERSRYTMKIDEIVSTVEFATPEDYGPLKDVPWDFLAAKEVVRLGYVSDFKVHLAADNLVLKRREMLPNIVKLPPVDPEELARREALWNEEVERTGRMWSACLARGPKVVQRTVNAEGLVVNEYKVYPSVMGGQCVWN